MYVRERHLWLAQTAGTLGPLGKRATEQPHGESVASPILIPTRLQEQAGGEAVDYFGLGIPEIPQPPALLLETLRIMQGKGFRDAQAMYSPTLSLEQTRNHPEDRHTEPDDWLYEQIKAKWINKSILSLSGQWVIFDASERPNHSDIGKDSPNDPLGAIILRGRNSGKIAKQISTDDIPRESWGERAEILEELKYVSSSSRSGVSPHEQDDVIFPALAEELGLTTAIQNGKVAIRRPALAEFIYAGRVRFPHLGLSNTDEFTNDAFTKEFIVTAGHVQSGGLTHVDYAPVGLRGFPTWFRFIIAFSAAG